MRPVAARSRRAAIIPQAGAERGGFDVAGADLSIVIKVQLAKREVVTPGGFEPPASKLGILRSIRLSYGATRLCHYRGAKFASSAITHVEPRAGIRNFASTRQRSPNFAPALSRHDEIAGKFVIRAVAIASNIYG